MLDSCKEKINNIYKHIELRRKTDPNYTNQALINSATTLENEVNALNVEIKRHQNLIIKIQNMSQDQSPLKKPLLFSRQ